MPVARRRFASNAGEPGDRLVHRCDPADAAAADGQLLDRRLNGQEKDGHLLLSPDVNEFFNNLTHARGPFSLLHLAAATDNGQEISYRRWMSTGVTFTGNRAPIA
jgi:hypothetical protein